MDATGKAGQHQLDELHGLVAENVKALLGSSELPVKVKGIELAMRFLKDNNITVNSVIPARVEEIRDMLPSAEELELIERGGLALPPASSWNHGSD